MWSDSLCVTRIIPPFGLQRVLPVLVVLTVVVAGFTIGVDSAIATEPARQQPTAIDSCTTITESGEYRLTEDIQNSNETVCIEIRASNVTLDGNGHVVDGRWNVSEFVLPSNANVTNETAADDGTQTPTPGNETLTANETAPLNATTPMGVYVNGNGTTVREDVTVRNLQVTDWVFGVSYDNSSDGRISNVNASTSYVGVIAQNTTATEVTEITAVDDLVGVHFFNVTDSELSSTTIRNGISGIAIHNSTENRMTNVTVSESAFLGVGLINSNAHRLANSSITDVRGTISFGPMNSTAIGIDNSSEFSVEDTVAANNENWTFISENESARTDVENLTVDGLSVSFTGQDVGLDTTTDDPLGRAENSTTTGVQVVKTSETSNVSIEVNWDDGANETTAAHAVTEGSRERRPR